MVNLVPIPWQPGYKLTPDTLALLIAASNRVGHNIEVVDAWRSYAKQAYYFDQYEHHGGPPASNPDTGQRNHMRGAAVDIKYTTAANRSAMLAVGFTADPVENWHFNNPNWVNMPIIPTDTAPVNVGPVTPIIKPQPLRKMTTRMEPISYIRNPSTGEITMLDYTNMTRRALSGSEWAALAAQGNAFGNATNAAEYANAINGFKPKA